MSEMTQQPMTAADMKELLRSRYGGENKKITDENYDKALAVKCKNGTFVGKKTENIVMYRGIPFVGKQPVGDLRWKAPVDVVPDDGVYEAYYNANSAFGNPEFETGSLYDLSEDCLYLNIWHADGSSSDKKPVMVWIHGGAFESGGTVDPMFDCHNLVKEHPDVIVVTLAYRLGPLGFLHLSHLPDGKDYTDSQNLGLLDQLMALKWVHENIAGFGGDPGNVTIWGESAGAGSCTMLPLIKGSHQYFNRVIAESGSVNQTKTPEEGIECTNKLMAELGCKTVAELLKVDGYRLLEAAKVLFTCQFPERDGKYLPTDTYKAYEDGAAKDIEFLVGCNKDEMNFFVKSFGPEGWDEWCTGRKARLFEKMTDEEKSLVESYCSEIEGDSFQPDSSLFSQLWFIVPTIKQSESQFKGGGKVYTYYFTPESPDPVMKCGHAIELSTVFNHPEMSEDTGREFDKTFSQTVRSMWVQFAKTGNPSLSEDNAPDGKVHEWPLYDTNDKKVMVLDEFDIHVEKETERKIVDWERTYFLTKYYMA